MITGEDLKPKEVLRTKRFYLITATMMLACIGGVIMIGFAKPIATAKGLALMAFAMKSKKKIQQKTVK